jgi:hypothetical protein
MYKNNIKCNFLLTFHPYIDFAFAKSAPFTRDKNMQDRHEVLTIPKSLWNASLDLVWTFDPVLFVLLASVLFYSGT